MNNCHINLNSPPKTLLFFLFTPHQSSKLAPDVWLKKCLLINLGNLGTVCKVKSNIPISGSEWFPNGFRVKFFNRFGDEDE